ncbi:class I SAM-dependent methyltransferase [Rudaeicoccus suwonensis]|uniref:Putative O-methyltransferase YrrM n=1 Tax=Rudaeicoccus suwonensis TaxID=657409 RepID=A0A561DVL9_9MICO|nr:class I SAM-dependent methyltransferase [Rudaeicoccus suwonensis]TWE07407.1 putative O-methyltransferase YrrM [Rudaeicoccus suwonensis]
MTPTNSSSRRAGRKRSIAYRIRRYLRAKLRRRVGAPDLYDLLGASGRRLAEPEDFVRRLANAAIPEEVISEFADLKKEFEDRRKSTSVPYELFHDIESASMLLCYALTRTLKPEIIVETGVGNGASTFFFLRALAKNNRGTLHSFDISDDVGVYLSGENQRSWVLHVLDARSPLEDLKREIKTLPPIDVFIHDSHHRYKYMTAELKIAETHLSSRGVILCDDAESTFAFEEFCRVRNMDPIYVFDRTKFFGGTSLAQA